MADIVATSRGSRRLKLDPYTTATPVNLNAPATLSPGDSNTVLGDAFRNPLPIPLELHELKWSLQTTPPPTPSGMLTTAHGLMVECSIDYQNYPITAKPVPLHALAPLISSRDENNAFAGVSGGTFIQDTYGVAFGKMPFDEPIYLLPGEQLNISLGHKSIVPQSITVNVSVSGRGVLTIPKVRRLPYVAVWSPAALDLSTNLTTAPLRVGSSEKDLVNASGAPLSLRRLVGRIVLSTPTTAGAASFLSLGDSPDARDVVNIQLRDSHGVAIAKDPTPIGVVFPPPSFAVETPMVLAPNAYILGILTTNGFVSAASSFKALVTCSMVGYREI